ncbi:regulatory factor X-associated protein [Ascaphus truei]|uniref:regulatory factor X-associated protein n=1 Tax=Ascaphus truei TaxID=8439 RepID=UPI003F5A8E2C
MQEPAGSSRDEDDDEEDEEEEEEEEDEDDGGGRLVLVPQSETEGDRQGLQYAQYQAEADAGMLFYNLITAEQEDESSDLLDTSDPRDSTASQEELEDDDNNSGDNDRVVTKICTYPSCHETTSQVAKQRKPWMCKKHRNKMYKDKYKKKKNDQAMTCTNKLEDNPECSISLTKQRTGSIGERPARPSLLEQVLNQKRLSLLRSPDVVQFLQTQQQLLSRQAFEQRQSLQGAPL